MIWGREYQGFQVYAILSFKADIVRAKHKTPTLFRLVPTPTSWLTLSAGTSIAERQTAEDGGEVINRSGRLSDCAS